jgi:hypothetical protein
VENLDYYRSLKRPTVDVAVGDEAVVTSVYSPRRTEQARITSSVSQWVTALSGHGQELLFTREAAGVGDERLAAAGDQADHDSRVKAAVELLGDRGIKMCFRDFADGHLIAMADLLPALDTPAAGGES